MILQELCDPGEISGSHGPVQKLNNPGYRCSPVLAQKL